MNCKGKCIHADECKRMLFPYLYNLATPEECDRFKSKDDVIEIVRCKDCKKCEHCFPAKAIGEEAVEGWYCKTNRGYVRPDDYCSYGEKKGSEGE